MMRHIMANHMSEFNKIHDAVEPRAVAEGTLGAAIGFARRWPEAALAVVLGSRLVVWTLSVFFLYHAISRGRLTDWMLAGASLAGCFWSKYTAFALAATLGLILLFDPAARRTWRTPGPYLMAATFLLVLAPNLWWLVDNGFQPFRYVNARAVSATHWYQYLTFPLIWTAGQLLAMLPAIGLLAILLYPGARTTKSIDTNGFARRYVTAVALGPFLFTTAAALVLGRQPIAMWGFALWSF